MVRIALSLCLVLACLTALAWAGDEPTPQIKPEESAAEPREASREAEQSRVVSPLVREIQTVREVERARLAEFFDEFATAPTEAAAMSVQKRIEALKRDTEIGVLRIQLRYALQDERRDTVARLEASLRAMNAEPETSQ